MATALGFNGAGNKNTPMSGGTGGGSIQPKLQLNGQGQLTTNGSGGILNYLQGLMSSPATAPASQPPLQPPAPDPGAAGAQGGPNAPGDSSGKSAAGSALASSAMSGAAGGGF